MAVPGAKTSGVILAICKRMKPRSVSHLFLAGAETSGAGGRAYRTREGTSKEYLLCLIGQSAVAAV